MRIFSGIQPTGQKHLGNYSGGFRQYVATQERGDAFFCIVDLHSVTVAYEPAALRESTLSLAALLLGTVTSFGELRRMHQFKDKGEKQDFISAGLFTYPVLMAGDILLYQTTHVPIGDDQRQHLELSRNIAERFNQRHGDTFVLPEGIYPGIGARGRG